MSNERTDGLAGLSEEHPFADYRIELGELKTVRRITTILGGGVGESGAGRGLQGDDRADCGGFACHEWCFLCVGVTLLCHVCRVRRGAMWVMQLVSAVCCAVTRRHSGGPTDCPSMEVMPWPVQLTF